MSNDTFINTQIRLWFNLRATETTNEPTTGKLCSPHMHTLIKRVERTPMQTSSAYREREMSQERSDPPIQNKWELYRKEKAHLTHNYEMK